MNQYYYDLGMAKCAVDYGVLRDRMSKIPGVVPLKANVGWLNALKNKMPSLGPRVDGAHSMLTDVAQQMYGGGFTAARPAQSAAMLDAMPLPNKLLDWVRRKASPAMLSGVHAMTGVKPGQIGVGQSGVDKTLLLAHEGFERTVKPHEIARHLGPGHLSPKVLMQESNLLAGLSGSGAADARATLLHPRTHNGEKDLMEALVARSTDGRFPYQYGETKLPKAMRKHMLSKWQGMSPREENGLRQQAAGPFRERFIQTHNLPNLPSPAIKVDHLGRSGNDAVLNAHYEEYMRKRSGTPLSHVVHAEKTNPGDWSGNLHGIFSGGAT